MHSSGWGPALFFGLNGIEVPSQQLFSKITGRMECRKLLELDEPVDAILATNNRLTAGVVRTLNSLNKRMPEDVALVGFDQVNWDVSTKVSITTVMQPGYDVGRTAVRTLIQQLQEPDMSKHDIVMPHRLVVRNSLHPRSSVALPEAHFGENFGS